VVQLLDFDELVEHWVLLDDEQELIQEARGDEGELRYLELQSWCS
jgi:hypothetical protein